MTVIESLLETWHTAGIANPHVATSRDIEEFEAKHGVRLPTALVEYFRRANGTKEGRCGMEDADLVSFWHLDQIDALAVVNPDDATPGGDSLFVFADHSIEAYAWAVRLSIDPTAATPVMVTYAPLQEVAASFEEFLQGYLGREQRVLFPTKNPEGLTARLRQSSW